MKTPFSLLILAAALVCATGCTPTDTQTNDVPFVLSDTMLKRCSFAVAELSEVKDEIKLFGKVAADNNKIAHVYPITGGIVSDVRVELGDYVQEGQLLATIRSSEVADFRRQLVNARADVALAEKNLEVARDLYAGKLNSEKELLASEQELEKARSEWTRINEVYAIYKLKSGSEYRITAPISGFIINKDITQNEELRTDRTEEVFSIAQINEVWVLANVNESNIGRVAVNYEAEVQTLSYPDKVFSGKVDKIFNVIDPATKAMKIVVKIANPDLLLKPDMNALVTLKFPEHKQLVAVPASAVLFDKNKNWVMVYKNKTQLETRLVEVYRMLGNVAWITSGVAAGERVIAQNGLLIYDALND